jgi:hypothetical protein
MEETKVIVKYILENFEAYSVALDLKSKALVKIVSSNFDFEPKGRLVEKNSVIDGVLWQSLNDRVMLASTNTLSV